MNIRIGDKEYKLEYTFEAALHGDCVGKVMSLFGGMAEAQKGDNQKEMMKEIAAMPRTVVSMFYAGLLEHNPVDSEESAKELLKQYFKENPDGENASFYGMAMSIIGQMEEDGFFRQIGLSGETQQTAANPQDHRRKAPDNPKTTAK